MAADMLDLPLLADLDCGLAVDSIFAELELPNFLSVLEQAELHLQPTKCSPSSSFSQHKAAARCPSAEVSSHADADIFTQLHQNRNVVTTTPLSLHASPCASPERRSSSSNISLPWLSALPSAAAAIPAAAITAAEAQPGSGNTSDSSIDAAQQRCNKRKAPEVDWRSIEDPEERRRQRRLAKNRITAARSRERKKVQLAGMEGRMQQLETENAQLKSLLEQCMKDNSSLREQLASLSRGAAATGVQGATEPAALLYIAIMLVLLHFLDARGLSQALGLILFTYVFFTATAAGKLSLKQLSAPFQQAPQEQVAAADTAIKQEPGTEADDESAADAQRWRQQQQLSRQRRAVAAASGACERASNWQALLQQSSCCPSAILADGSSSMPAFCGVIKHELQKGLERPGSMLVV